MKTSIWLISAFLVLSFLQPGASAAMLQISGGGIFPANTPVTGYTNPGVTWSFSFTVSNPPVNSTDTAAGFDVNYSNFSYSLNQAAVVITVSPQVRFFVSDYGGMMDIDFVNGADPDMDPVTGIALAGPTMFTGSTVNPTLQTGSYTATSGTFWVGSAPVQVLGGTVVTAATSSASAPEPNTGFCFLGALVCFIASAILRQVLRRKSQVRG